MAAKGKTKQLVLTNEPTFYPDFFPPKAENTESEGMNKESWGRLSMEDENGNVVGIEVFQIASKDKMICRHETDYFFLKGISTKDIAEARKETNV